MLLGNQLGIAPGDLAASTSPVNAQQGIADGNNWAVGGYRTDQIYDSITAANGSLIERDNTLLRSRDGYLVDRARQGLGADPNALYYITGGGNDFLQGRILNDLQAQQAASRLVDSVQALQQAGARYIVVWLLPDLGLTPATFGGPLQPFASQLSGTFNAELTAQLSQAGANVIPLNIPLLLGRHGQPGFLRPGRRPEPDRHLFQRQRLHHEPDLRDQRQHARPEQTAVQRQRAPDHHRPAPDRRLHLFAAVGALGLTLLPEMAHGTLRAYQDELRSQWQADWENWQNVGQWRGFVGGGGQRLDFDSPGQRRQRRRQWLQPDPWRQLPHRRGLARRGRRRFLPAEAGSRRQDSDYRMNSYMASAFVQYQETRWWADAALTGGYLDYDDLKRKFALGGGERSEGDTNGHLWAFSARLGYDIAQQADSPWHLSPFVSADYARVEVDGYSEKGASATALDYDDQKRSSKRLGAGLQGKYAFGSDTQLFAEYAHEREYEDDTQDLTMSLNSLPGNRFTLEGYTPQDHLNRVSLGFSQKLAPELRCAAATTGARARTIPSRASAWR